VHVAAIADDYRGMYRRGEATRKKYAAHGRDLPRTEKEARSAAYIAETLPSAGQIVFPRDYQVEVYKFARLAACIADEVCWFGWARTGDFKRRRCARYCRFG
jgi:4-aminobutyrate aminotransferase-like enzyme